MDREYKNKTSKALERTIKYYILIVLFSLLWTNDFYERYLNAQISLLIMSYVGVFIGLFLIVLYFTLRPSYIIKENYIIKNVNGLFRRRKKYIFFSKENLIVERKGSIIKEFLYQTEINIYNNNRKILNLVLNKDIALKISDELTYSYDLEKKHFVKDKDFVFSGKNFLTLFIEPTVGFFILYFINFIVWKIFNIGNIKVFNIRFHYLIFSLLIALILYTFVEIIYFVHNSNTSVRVNDLNIRISKGRLFRYHLSISRKTMSSFEIKYYLFTKYLGVYFLSFKKNIFNRLYAPLHRANINNILGRDIILYKIKNDHYFLSFFASLLLTIGITVGLVFFDIFIAIVFFILGLLFSIKYLSYNCIYEDGKILIKKFGYQKRISMFDLREIQKVKMYKYPNKHYRIFFYLKNGVKHTSLINDENLNTIKAHLGYYK